MGPLQLAGESGATSQDGMAQILHERPSRYNSLATRVLTAAAVRLILIMLLITALVYFIVARATRESLIHEHASALSARGL